MHKMEKFLNDCIEHTERHMESVHIDDMTFDQKNYIIACCELCLKAMAVLAGKRAYDKHMPPDADPHHSIRQSSMNL